MAYCRFSSDDFRSDVYVYESESGWVTDVASVRYTIDPSALPPPVPLTPDMADAWLARHQVVMGLVADAAVAPIGLSHDGAHFLDRTPGACAARLRGLTTAGYRVPEGVVEALDGEQRDLGCR